MEKTNYNKINVKADARVELHDALKLSGAEISINVLPAGASVPFVHFHKQNEEVYGILEGKGYVILDDERIELKPGDWLKVSPKTRRRIFAAKESTMKYVCIQVKENSLEEYTQTDAVIV